MSISYVANSAPQVTAAAATPSYPASIALNDCCLWYICSDSASIGAPPAGWQQIGPVVTAGGVSSAVFTKPLLGTESGTQNVAITGGTKGVTFMVAYRSSTGKMITATNTGGADADTSNNVFTCVGAAATTVAGDWIVGMTTALAAASGAFSAAASGLSLAQANAAMGAGVPRTGTRTASNTMGYELYDRPITTGATGAITYTSTWTGANAAGSGD